MIAVLAVGFPMGVVWSAPHTQFSLPVLLSLLFVAYCGVRLSHHVLDGETRLLRMTFWLFSYIWLGLSATVQLVSDSFPLTGTYSEGTRMFATAVIGLGSLAFDVGYHYCLRAPLPYPAARLGIAGRRVADARLIVTGGLSLAYGTYMITALGGIQAFYQPRNDFFEYTQDVFAAGDPTIAVMGLRMLTVPCFICFYALLHRLIGRDQQDRRRTSPFYWALLLALGVFTLIANNPFTTPRFWLGTIALSLLFSLINWGGRVRTAALVMGVLLTVLAVFPYADLFRRSLTPGPALLTGLEPLSYKGDFDAYQQVMNTIDYTKEEGLTWGRQMAGAALFWVPRRFWENKPLPTTDLVAGYFGHKYTNLSLPLWGEAYVDGGVFAVGIVFFLYGAVLSRLDTLYLGSARDPRNIVGLIVPILAAYQFLLLRGSLIVATAFFAPVLLLMLLVTRPSKDSRPDNARAHN